MVLDPPRDRNPTARGIRCELHRAAAGHHTTNRPLSRVCEPVKELGAVRARRRHWPPAAAAEASASLSRGVCTKPQAAKGRHGACHREHRQAVRRRCRRACGRRTTRGRLLRHSGEAPVARHLPDCLGETPGPGGEEFPLECPACGGDIRLIAFRLLSECETIPGLRTLGSLRFLRTSCPRPPGRSERSSRTWANRSNRRRSLPPMARPPTGASSCKSTFDRDIFQASPDELPAIDIHSL